MLHAPLEHSIVTELDGRGLKLGERELHEDIAAYATMEADLSEDKESGLYSSKAELGTYWFVRELKTPRMMMTLALINESPIKVKEAAPVIDTVIRNGDYYGELLMVYINPQLSTPIVYFGLRPDGRCDVSDRRERGLLNLFECSIALGIKSKLSSALHNIMKDNGKKFEDVTSEAKERFDKRIVGPEEVAKYVVDSFRDYL